MYVMMTNHYQSTCIHGFRLLCVALLAAGINDTIKELALLVADAGPYHVLVPDLYKGKLGVDAEEASHVRCQCMRFCLCERAQYTGHGKEAARHVWVLPGCPLSPPQPQHTPAPAPAVPCL
jgi:hypothetical protein